MKTTDLIGEAIPLFFNLKLNENEKILFVCSRVR